MSKKFGFNFGKKEEEIKAAEKGSGDDRFFKLSLGKEESVTAIIRLLPDADGNPFVKYYEHSFEYEAVDNSKKRYWKNCINTFGYDEKCPICEKNMIYYNSTFLKDKAISKQRARKLNYVSNIYVVKNSHDPSTEGKVYLFKYGKTVYDKIKQRWFPTDADKQDPEFKQFIPFDLYEGADFFLKIKKQGEFDNGTPIPNYEESKFLSQSAFLDGKDAKIEPVMGLTHKIEEFVDPKKFPSNEEVLKVLGHLLGHTVVSVESDQLDNSTGGFDMGDDDIPFDFPKDKEPVQEPIKESVPTPEPSTPAPTPAEEPKKFEVKEPEPSTDEDDSDSFFDQFK